MARRRYYRRSARVVYPRKKWASNIVQQDLTTTNYKTLVVNNTQTSTPTPVIVKCGNFKIQGDVIYSLTAGGDVRPLSLTFYIVFVPEGVTPNDSLVGNHPEWIMGWTTIDTGILGTASGNADSAKFSITSRLKRNLNSGDRVVTILQTLDSSITAKAVYTCQYWTCSN